ncbi:HPP family protein [Pseudoalteromonas sp. GCY]|uniref:HPP family protein n=1 Tax=Pseudoalteromonas sp. GCY TaxID=2003316 RepID=UPI000BFEC7A5|nr:HPP family protein [Pseudoalteromonas sp. GCY]PHI35405.1 HPP family protein [Pseudoalteromonas sp. GCY]QQQ68486.1 HPP family protein [Pseudoalteromonas sp. GCY]
MREVQLALIAGAGAFIAIAILAFSQTISAEHIFLMAPLGATAVLVFGVPESPLAQPKNVIFGHIITAIIGIIFAQYIGVNEFTLALATGLGVFSMLVTKTTHPPAGANPILIMLALEGWSFLFTPVIIGAVVLVLVGKATLAAKTKLTTITAA